MGFDVTDVGGGSRIMPEGTYDTPSVATGKSTQSVTLTAEDAATASRLLDGINGSSGGIKLPAGFGGMPSISLGSFPDIKSITTDDQKALDAGQAFMKIENKDNKVVPTVSFVCEMDASPAAVMKQIKDKNAWTGALGDFVESKFLPDADPDGDGGHQFAMSIPKLSGTDYEYVFGTVDQVNSKDGDALVSSFSLNKAKTGTNERTINGKKAAPMEANKGRFVVKPVAGNPNKSIVEYTIFANPKIPQVQAAIADGTETVIKPFRDQAIVGLKEKLPIFMETLREFVKNPGFKKDVSKPHYGAAAFKSVNFS